MRSPPSYHRNCPYNRWHSYSPRLSRNCEMSIVLGWYLGTTSVKLVARDSGMPHALYCMFDGTCPQKTYDGEEEMGSYLLTSPVSLFFTEMVALFTDVKWNALQTLGMSRGIDLGTILLWRGISQGVAGILTTIRYKDKVLSHVAVLLVQQSSWFSFTVVGVPSNALQ